MKKLLIISTLALLTATEYVNAAAAGGAGAGAGDGAAFARGRSSSRSRSPYGAAGGAGAGAGDGAAFTRGRSSSRSRSPYGAAGGAGAGAAIASTSSGDELSSNMKDFLSSLKKDAEAQAWGMRLIDSVKASARGARPGEPINFPMEGFNKPNSEVLALKYFAEEHYERPIKSDYNAVVNIGLDRFDPLSDKELNSTKVDRTIDFDSAGYTFKLRIKFGPADFVTDPDKITLQLRYVLENFLKHHPLNFKKKDSELGMYMLDPSEYYFSDSPERFPVPGGSSEPYLIGASVSPIKADLCRKKHVIARSEDNSCRISALSLTLEVQKSS